ncbi:acyltransferase family protein [Epilithonimonas sp.]|uniref:acyltransferase family protein n=1 Tax=Epilithonimonas sp. TaxID=2894511 RepID=UPI002FDDFE12
MIKPLTSLRFFFAFCVFLSHIPFSKDDSSSYLYNHIFSEGFLGVSFFFILSGFILALNYRNKFKNKEITLKKFYIARFARIYPLHFFTLLASIPVMFNSIKVLIFNIFLLQSYVPNPKYYFSYNAPSWSISDEMFFYTLFPLLILISYKLKPFFKILLLIGFICLIIIMNQLLPENKIHYWLYISPVTRVFDFILGILLFDLCLYIKNSKINISRSVYNFIQVSAFVILALFFICKDYLPISYRYSIFYWLPMCLIILTSASSFFLQKKESIVSKILSWKWLVYLGEISFGFYLIHYLVIAYLKKYNGYMGHQLEGFLLVFLMFTITLITSIFAYEKIEKPFNRKLKDLLS